MLVISIFCYLSKANYVPKNISHQVAYQILIIGVGALSPRTYISAGIHGSKGPTPDLCLIYRLIAI